MNTQTLLPFEAEALAVIAFTKAAKKAAREARRAEEQILKDRRRWAREARAKLKNPPGFAQCGINYYPTNSGWTRCRTCGQPLIYTTDPHAAPQICGATTTP